MQGPFGEKEEEIQQTQTFLTNETIEPHEVALQTENKRPRSSLLCTCCKESGYTKERCMSLHGKPSTREGKTIKEEHHNIKVKEGKITIVKG